MRKLLTLCMLLVLMSLSASAQRVIDKLDRGLIAIKVSNGVYVNWRIQSDEYYDVTYNLYRDGQKVAENLKVSNYTDAAGTSSSKYTVAAVVKGKEQTQCNAVTPWAQDYLEIKPKHHSSLKSTYVPNDACCADVDGDGQVEILLKYDNQSEISQSFPKNGPTIDGTVTHEYSLFECLKLDGTVLWWVNCGPNMGDFQNNEQNIVAYDWDQDGKAEALFRAADGTTIHMADGTVYTVGDASLNYRGATGGGTNWFMHSGKEYLLYVNGATGKPYVDMEYPLKRVEDSANPSGVLSGSTYDKLVENAWGDGYGHRASKFFFGAPYLDGRKPSIFLGRGIYTQHKFITYDVDPATHQLKERWRWYNNADGPWKWQGYHNYAIVDVDMDGRDEIVWGSMVIDDNGKGLSTSALGHGDAQHHGDLDPYTWGQEGFFCNEDHPGNNLRNLTTSEIYYRVTAPSDDGRAICGNFSNDYPGCQASSGSDYAHAISTVTHAHLPIGTDGMSQNFRIYWDGDLCEESFNYVNGKNTEGGINKPGKGTIKRLTGSMTNNDTKGTPCYQGDILGDWREEVIMRTASNNIRIYTTTDATKWRNYSLWYDHQYRNAMVWQMCGYNQPPHASYFLGELEGITMAPPSLTMEGRHEMKNGGTMNSARNGETVIACETNDMTIDIVGGITPAVFIDNAPSWVQGYAGQQTTVANDPSKIKYEYYTHTLTGGGFAGAMRLVKQGEGTLVLPNVEQIYSGNTDVWAGTLSFDGKMTKSRLWLNRFAKLISNGGSFKTIQADYASEICPGGVDKVGTITADSLILGFGARLNININSDKTCDNVNARVLKIEKKVWPNGHGPAYDAPVIAVKFDGDAVDGTYELGEVSVIDGNISDLVIEGPRKQVYELVYDTDTKKLSVKVTTLDSEPMTWIGDKSGNWNVNVDKNFKSDDRSVDVVFTNDSEVTFADNASVFNVVIAQPVAPKSVVFNNSSKEYTISGDSIIGEAPITKNGGANVNINNINRVGATTINGGVLTVKQLASKAVGNEYGALGNESNGITIANGARLRIAGTTTSNQGIYISEGDGFVDVNSGVTFTQTKGIFIKNGGNTLTKAGTGTMTLPTTFGIKKLIITNGTVNISESNSVNMLPATVELQGGSLIDTNSEGSYSSNNANFIVPEGKTASFTLDPRCNYKGTLTGAGTLNLYASGVRCYLQGDWSGFEGELVARTAKRGSYDPSTAYWDNTKSMPKAILNVPSGFEFNNNGKSITLKALKSNAAGTLSGTGTYTIGAGYDANITLSNIIKSPIVYKGEEGKYLYISSANFGKLDNNLTISSGSLRAAGTSSSSVCVNGDHLITVNGTGNVYGTTPYIYSITATNGGRFTVASNSDGVTTARTKNNVTVNAGGILDMKIGSSTSSSKLTCGETLKFSSNAVLNIRLADGVNLADGNKFTLWTAKNFFGTIDNVTLQLPELPSGLKWDTSELFATTGVLKVVKDEASAIENIASDAILVADIYTVDGKNLGRITTTKAALKANVKKAANAKGNYIVKFISGTNTESIVVNLR